MKRLMITTAVAFAVAIAAGFSGTPALADGAMSLRGKVDIPTQEAPAPVYRLSLNQESFPRNFKEQPPLTPHKVEKYRINLKANGCLKCHDKDTYKEEDAPLAGKSHYMGEDGKEMEILHMSRYFCNQCHVPQVDAKPLVANTFVGVPVK